MSTRTHALFAVSLGILCLLAPPSRAQTDEEIVAQTRQIQAEIAAIKEANAKKETIEEEMKDIQLSLDVIDGCLNKGGILVAGPLGMGCAAITKENLTRLALMEVLEGKLAVKDVATRIRDIVQAGNAVRSALRAEREALAHEYENARLRLINVQVPKSGSGPVQGQSGNAAPPQAASPAPAQSSNAPKYCAIYGDKSESCEQLTFADCWQKPHCLGVDPDLTHRCLKRSDGGWYCGKPQ